MSSGKSLTVRLERFDDDVLTATLDDLRVVAMDAARPALARLCARSFERLRAELLGRGVHTLPLVRSPH